MAILSIFLSALMILASAYPGTYNEFQIADPVIIVTEDGKEQTYDMSGLGLTLGLSSDESAFTGGIRAMLDCADQQICALATLENGQITVAMDSLPFLLTTQLIPEEEMVSLLESVMGTSLSQLTDGSMSIQTEIDLLMDDLKNMMDDVMAACDPPYTAAPEFLNTYFDGTFAGPCVCRKFALSPEQCFDLYAQYLLPHLEAINAIPGVSVSVNILDASIALDDGAFSAADMPAIHGELYESEVVSAAKVEFDIVSEDEESTFHCIFASATQDETTFLQGEAGLVDDVVCFTGDMTDDIYHLTFSDDESIMNFTLSQSDRGFHCVASIQSSDTSISFQMESYEDSLTIDLKSGDALEAIVLCLKAAWNENAISAALDFSGPYDDENQTFSVSFSASSEDDSVSVALKIDQSIPSALSLSEALSYDGTISAQGEEQLINGKLTFSSAFATNEESLGINASCALNFKTAPAEEYLAVEFPADMKRVDMNLTTEDENRELKKALIIAAGKIVSIPGVAALIASQMSDTFTAN